MGDSVGGNSFDEARDPVPPLLNVNVMVSQPAFIRASPKNVITVHKSPATLCILH